MTESRNTDIAVLLAPLVLVAWFLWPFFPFDHSLKDVGLAVLTAYAFFFLVRFLSRAALSFIGRSSPAFLLSTSFLAADAISLIVRLAMARMTSGIIIDRELHGAALDSLWCTLAIAIAEGRRWRREEGEEPEPADEEREEEQA
jgi:hypothetical protein